jgi:ATP-binding cassette subfamily B protein
VEEEILGKAYDRRLMRRLVAYLRPYWKAVALSLILLLILSALQVVGPLLTKLAVDRYLDPAAGQSRTPLDPYLSPDPWTGLAQLSALYLLVVGLSFVFDFAQSYLMQWTGQRAMLDLRRQIMSHLQRLDLAFYDRTPVGRLLTRVTTDVDALNELLASGLVTILGDLLALTFVIIAMLQLSPGMTGILLALMPAVILVTIIFRRQATESYRRIRVAIARINAYLQEHISGISVLQLFNREKKSAAEFERINRQHMEAFKDAIVAYGWFYPVVEFLAMLSLALLLAYGGFQISQGALTLGVLVAFFQYGMRFFRPIQDLSEKYNILQSAMAASERIFGLLDTPVRVAAPSTAKPFPEGSATVEFDRVWFAYSGEDWVLRDVSFSIAPGETVAVVGHTGAGKTTVISLLLRFYDVQRGAIRIGGIDIREFDPRDLRRHFGVVLQDPHLFSGTIQGNIRLGTETISDEELVSAAEQVNLLEFIRSLPDGFAQPVRERGDGLSTGQKQLISFARALAHNPRFLILDEATSSVDTETEFRVREALARLVEGRTSIVIAHRLSTIQRADRILVMHKGRLRETGTHQELLAVRGIYWKLYQLQYKDQEVRESREPRAPALEQPT